MARNILLTTLSAADSDLPVRYFSVRKEFDLDYCDVLLDAEAGIKATLARYPIDEIIIIGGERSYNEKDSMERIPLDYGKKLYSADRASLSTYGLLQQRIARYVDEVPEDHDAWDARIPEEIRQKLTRFIQDFQQADPELKEQKPNRLFDALAQDSDTYERFWNELFEACPELRDYSDIYDDCVKGYLYSELKPSAKLELLPANRKAGISFLPEDRIENNEQWVDSLMAMQKTIVKDEEDINLYVSINSESAGDSFMLMNMMDLLVAMPGGGVNLNKIFTVRGPQRTLTGVVSDDTYGFGVTELMHATRAFLNYGRADMIVNIWEKSGQMKGQVASMVYAMRHVDVGLSMCNIPEMEDGIRRLRQLFRDEKLWREFGYYGMLFGVMAESIRKDYGALVEGDGEIPFIDMVKWAYRHQFYQQTLTLIEAKAPDLLVKNGIFYYCDDPSKKAHVTQLLAEKRLELRPHEFYVMDIIEHYFIKNYDRGRRSRGDRNDDPQRLYAALRVKSVANTDPSLITGYTACDSMETLENALYAYYHIGIVRNKISHADAKAMADSRLIKSESDESSALLWMKEGIDYFIESYEKAMAEVKDKNPNVVLIHADEVRSAADHMKYDRRKEKSDG